MSKASLLELRDRAPVTPAPTLAASSDGGKVAPSRKGLKAMTGYFPPELSFSMHMTARKNGMTLQDAMREAMNDWLRKMGESPVG